MSRCHELQIRSPLPNTCLACCQIVRNGWLVAALCAAPVKCEGLHFGIISCDGAFRLHVRLASEVPWGIAAALPPATRQFCSQAGQLLSQRRGGCAKTSTFTALKSRTTSERGGRPRKRCQEPFSAIDMTTGHPSAGKRFLTPFPGPAIQ